MQTRILTGFVLGLAVGALYHYANKTKPVAQDPLYRAVDTAKAKVDEARDPDSELHGKLQQTTEQVRDAVQEQVAKAQEKGHEAADRAQDVAHDAVKKAKKKADKAPTPEEVSAKAEELVEDMSDRENAAR
jgi:uncharacterized membrane-anchored protein YhcB (DUF1043 family)